MPKMLDAGLLPPPTDNDQELASLDDIDPGYAATRNAALLARENCDGVSTKAARLGGGVFDFNFPDDDTETVVTLTS